MKHHYFVSYQFNDDDGRYGFGQICVVTNKAVTTAEDTVALNEAVGEATPTSIGIIILFFHLLRVDDETEGSERQAVERALVIASDALDWYAMIDSERADEAMEEIEELLSPEAFVRIFKAKV